jgi:heterodisulfide reductase subunit A-like polyferredoxin
LLFLLRRNVHTFALVPPTVTDVDRNILIQLSGVISGIQGALPVSDPGVAAALLALQQEIGTLILQTSK